MVWPMVKDSSVEVISTRQRISGSMSRLLVTSRLLTTVSSTLSTSPGGDINPSRSMRSIDVVFRMAVPSALRLEGREIVGSGGLIIHGRRRLHQDLAQLLLFARWPRL